MRRRRALGRFFPRLLVRGSVSAVSSVKLVFVEIVPVCDPQRWVDPAGIDPPSNRDVGNVAVSFSNLPPRQIFLRHTMPPVLTKTKHLRSDYSVGVQSGKPYFF
jgi:hypothetical protein